MIGQQRFAFGQIRLGPRQLQFSGFDERIGLVRGRPFLAHLAHGLRQRTGRAAQTGLRVDRIHAHQYLARLDQLGVVGKHGNDRAGNLRGNHHLVAVYIGIVGALALGEHQYPVRRPQRTQDDEYHRDENQDVAPLAVGRR